MKVKDIIQGMHVKMHQHFTSENPLSGVVFHVRGYGPLFISDTPSIYMHDAGHYVRKYVMKKSSLFTSHEEFNSRCWYCDARFLEPAPIDLDQDDGDCI